MKRVQIAAVYEHRGARLWARAWKDGADVLVEVSNRGATRTWRYRNRKLGSGALADAVATFATSDDVGTAALRTALDRAGRAHS